MHYDDELTPEEEGEKEEGSEEEGQDRQGRGRRRRRSQREEEQKPKGEEQKPEEAKDKTKEEAKEKTPQTVSEEKKPEGGAKPTPSGGTPASTGPTPPAGAVPTASGAALTGEKLGAAAAKTGAEMAMPKTTPKVKGYNLNPIKAAGDTGLRAGYGGLRSGIKPIIGEEADKKLQQAEDTGSSTMDAMGAPKRAIDTAKDIAAIPKKVKKAVEEVKKVPERARKLAKAIKETPEKIKQAAKAAQELTKRPIKETAKLAGQAAKQAAKKGAQEVGKRSWQTAKDVVTKPIRAVKDAINTVKATVQAVKAGVEITSKAVKVAVEVGGNVIKFLVSNPVGWAIDAILLLVLIFWLIFMSGKNYVNSLAGGSIFVPANYSNEEHRAIVQRLQEKMSGPECDHKLVIYDQGKTDLDWQYNSDTGQYTNKIDIRILKTIDYLTDRHRIRVDLLTTGAPDILRENFLLKLDQYQHREDSVILPEDWNDRTPEAKEDFIKNLSPEQRANISVGEEKETLSAFKTGQAMAITEIDRSNLPELQNQDTTTCGAGAPLPAPIAINWQKTALEKLIRPTWEELAFTSGFLNQQLSSFVAMHDDATGRQAETAARDYINSLNPDLGGGIQVPSQVKEWFRKVRRMQQLLERVQSWSGQELLSEDTKAHFELALAQFNRLSASIGISDVESYDEARVAPIAEIIRNFGSPELVLAMNDAVDNVYRGTQTTNMVEWDKGDLDYRKAYESRSKIREVIMELMQMPNKTALSADPVIINDSKHFDENLVVKQIITFSPEDDLDNGILGKDIFPFGINSIGAEGVGMDPSGKDGKVNYADLHFSHAPIDNGVFSKYGINWVYSITSGAGILDFITGVISPFKIDIWAGVSQSFQNLMSGTLDISLLSMRVGEGIYPIGYQKFLHVAF